MPDPDPLDAPVPDWAPTASDVRDEMPGRKASLDRVDDAEIEELIHRRALTLQAELPAVLPDRLHSTARDYLTYAVASILEDRLFPQQAAMDGSNAERLDRRAGAELVRLRAQLGETDAGTGGHWSGSISLARGY